VVPDADPDEFAALAELAEIFGELVDALHRGQPAELSPDRIVQIAVRCVPRSRSAGLVVVDARGPVTVAATDDVGKSIDRIRSETGQGPALDILETNDLVVCDELPGDERWPDFGRRATDETGIRSLISYRLYLGRGRRAALSFYSDWPYAFDELAITTGAIFAAYCSLALFTTYLFDEPLSRRRSGEVHREIGVAVGILMAAHGIDTSAAYARLHGSARELRKSLPEMAEYVHLHGDLPRQES
jgi:hypothetical protein